MGEWRKGRGEKNGRKMECRQLHVHCVARFINVEMGASKVSESPLLVQWTWSDLCVYNKGIFNT